MRSPASMERLDALGIDVWVRRRRDNAVQSPSADSVASDARGERSVEPRSPGARAVLRVRMASGDGQWLLVQDAAWDGRHERLLGDIQATLGSAGCRFGQWAHSDSAGVALDELASRGVSRVLAFGEPPGEAAGTVVVAPDLETLARRPDARRRLWQLLAPELDD